MSARIKKRVAATAEWASEVVARDHSNQTLLTFEEDRRGSASKRRKLARAANADAISVDISSLKHKSAHSEVAVLKRILEKPGRGVVPEKKNEDSLEDIWGADDVNEAPHRELEVKAALKKTAPNKNFSYNPAFESHQEALAEAYALELRQREDQKRKAEGHLLLLAPDTPALEEDSQSSDEEDDNVGQGDGSTRTQRSLKQSKKLTRAQRNKIRARNIAGVETAKEKAEKDIIKSIDNMPLILRELDADERRHAAEEELRSLRDRAHEGSQGMTYAEAGEVPLTDELRGSLRTLLPKGILIKAAEADMRRSGKLMVKGRREERRGEKPHGKRNLKWVAKYKYV
jgi:hypothetical protein